MTLPTRTVGTLAAMLRSHAFRTLHPIRALLVATLLSAIACFSPAAALAQSAGDEQYRDPLAGDTGGGNNPRSGSNTGASDGTQATAQQQTPQSTTTQAPAGSAGSAGASANSQLPRTGSDAPLPLVGLGLVMLTSGLLLHRKILPARRAQGIYLFHN